LKQKTPIKRTDPYNPNGGTFRRVCLCYGWAAVAAPLFAAPTLRSIGGIDTSAPESVALGVSSGGTVVGASYQADFDLEAVSWTAVGGLRRLGDLSGGVFESQANAISRNGQVIVGFGTNADDNMRAFRKVGSGSLVSLGLLPGADPDFDYSEALACSADGAVVVGWSDVNGPTAAFRWTSAGMTSLGFLKPTDDESRATGVSDDGLVVVGWSGEFGGAHAAFRWTAATGMKPLGFPPEVTASEALAVSPEGTVIVGSATTVDEVTRPFRWTAAKGVEWLAAEGTAHAVSANGAAVVGDDGFQAVLWTGSGMIPLHTLLLTNGVAVGDWSLDEATGISADGDQVVGNGTDPDVNSVGWVLAGLNSARPLEPPPMLGIRLAGGVATISWQGVKGREYALYRSPTLSPWTETFVDSILATSDGPLQLMDDAPPKGQAFYRIEIDYAPLP
jgi:probable HAF family extracellular repeat protein